MKCLSLWQPWATLLASGAKRVETRSWATRHRGPLLVHAAKFWSADLAELCLKPPFREHLLAAGIALSADLARVRRGWNLPFGAIIGRVDVVACVPTECCEVYGGPGFRWWTAHLDLRPPRVTISDQERAFGNYGPGRFALLCENPVRFGTPVPCRGRQGFFDAEGPA